MLARQRKTSSACNLRRPSISGESSLSPYQCLRCLCPADLTTDSIQEESYKSEATPPESGDNTPRIISPPDPLATLKPNRSSSFNSSVGSSGTVQVDPLPSGLVLHHRRLGSWSQAASNTPPSTMHRRQQSLVSGQSSKSTSAYSTLSERSGASMEGGDVESISGSLRGRLTILATSSRVEQSRVDPQAVINNLFSGQTFDSKEADKVGGGLKIYVDRNSGTVTLAGPNLDRYG